MELVRWLAIWLWGVSECFSSCLPGCRWNSGGDRRNLFHWADQRVGDCERILFDRMKSDSILQPKVLPPRATEVERDRALPSTSSVNAEPTPPTLHFRCRAINPGSVAAKSARRCRASNAP